MGDRRYRKSSWDTVAETKNLSEMSERNFWPGEERHSRHYTGRYHESSVSGATAAPKSGDYSGWESWDAMEENLTGPMKDSFIKSRQSALDEDEIGGGNRYLGRGSPSQGRSRTRGRSRSRSLTRGREREYERGREPERRREIGRRNWSRSRSRSRDEGSGRRPTRSRSPIEDFRHQSYGWSDRRSAPEKSSQICREFSAGRCRRGSQCRFLHPDDTSYRGGDIFDDQTEKVWKQRADQGHTLKPSYSRGHGFDVRDDVPGPHRGDNEQLKERGTSAIPCKDFMKGKCRWGDSCRFSHNFGSEDGIGRVSRNASFGRDIDHQVKDGKPLCKFFAAGKCEKDNCRFSHGDPKVINPAGRKSETDNHSLHDKGSRWSGPTWDDATRSASSVKPTGWNQTDFRSVASSDDTNNEKRDNRWSDGSTNTLKRYPRITDPEGKQNETDGQGSRDKISRWSGPTWDDAARISKTAKHSGWNDTVNMNITITDDTTNGRRDDVVVEGSQDVFESWEDLPEWTDNSLNREKETSPPSRGIGRYNGGIGTSVSDGNTYDKQHLVLHGTQLNQDRISNIWDQNRIHVEQSFAAKVQQNVSPASQFQPDHLKIVENNLVNAFGSGLLDKMDSKDTGLQILFSGQNLNLKKETTLPGHSLNSNETDRSLNMLKHDNSAEFSIDLNGPEILRNNPVDLEPQIQNHHEVVQPPVVAQRNVSQFLPYSSLTSENTAEMTNSSVAVTNQHVPQGANPNMFPTFLNQQSNIQPVLEDSKSSGMMTSFSATSEHAPLVSTIDTRPVADTVSVDLLNPKENGRNVNEHVKYSLQQGATPNNQMHMQRSSSPPIVGAGFDNAKVKHPGTPRPKQEDVGLDSDTNEENEAIGEESKDIKENKGPETQDGRGRAEESNANKDEKGMRVFKNALIEFVKDLLKPKWKEGKMSREVHKTIVKKVVDKVTSTIQADHIPKTLDKAELYLSNAKPKISKLVQAYVERCMKTES